MTPKKDQALIDQVNQYAKDNDLFWLAGLVRETYPVLNQYQDKLDPIVKIAVNHYADQKGG